jgi:glycosyltransferase involved in cell wall biosynthesis
MRCEWERFRNPGVRTWNWLDTALFRPPTVEERVEARRFAECEEDRFAIVSIGNCNEVKNHSAILRALPLLPESQQVIYLHIGKEQAGEPERALAFELGIDDRVRFLGTQSEPKKYLWAADAFVMPSLYEGLGVSGLEAIACGVTAVVSDVEGLQDIVAETRWTVVTGTDAVSVARGIGRVMDTPPEERRQKAREDSHLVRECFSVSNGIRSIVEGLYRSDVPTALSDGDWH